MKVGQPSQRERQRAETHDRIFQAALAEFRDEGFGHAQIERIAQAAGVVRGTFYFHFPSKEHVLLELQQRTQQELLRPLEALDPTTVRLAELLATLARGVEAAQALVGNAGLMRDMIALYVGQPPTPAFAEAPAPLAERLTRLLQGSRERGELRAGLEPERVARLVLSSVFGLFARPTAAAEDPQPDLQGLLDVVRHGIAATGS